MKLQIKFAILDDFFIEKKKLLHIMRSFNINFLPKNVIAEKSWCLCFVVTIRTCCARIKRRSKEKIKLMTSLDLIKCRKQIKQ